jgi:hypothetical protein
MKVDSQQVVTNLNSDKLDNLDSKALGEITLTSHQRTDQCDTPSTWNECAKVVVRVPADNAYEVTVWSSFSATGASNTTVFYCPGFKGAGGSASFSFSCMTPTSDYIELPTGQAESAAISEHESLWGGPAGTTGDTYTFSTGVNPDAALGDDANQNAHTTVMVRDSSAPMPSIN